MLRSVIPDQISPEGKFNNFFQLAKDENNIWERKMEDYTNKLKKQMENQTNEISDQDNNNEIDEDEDQ